MNALTTLNTTNATLTMSSREIAELTGKRHDHVMRDIRNMIVELHGEEGLPKFGDTYRNEQNGQLYPEFRLPKDLTITLVSGYNVQMRYAITKRWMELEAQQAPKLPQTFAEALRLAAELEEQRAYLAQENQKLTIENEAMAQELNVLTVDEFRALSHLYLSHGNRIKLSNYAKAYCKTQGLEVTKQVRYLPSIDREVEVNVYPREALEHAAEIMGLI